MYNRKSITIILGVALLFILKGQLHHIGPEVGSGHNEMAKLMYIVESNFSPHLVTRVNTNGQKLVALTFDDGPDPRYTPQVLAVLREQKVKATFFVIGEKAREYPDLVKREIAEGHEVENHTYTHPDLSYDSDVNTADEIEACEKAIVELTGEKPHYFRPPKGLFKSDTIKIAEARGYRVVLWTICVEHHAAKTPDDMASRVIRAARPGAIILAHDGRLNRTKTVASLNNLIDGYKKKGYRFVTLSEMMSAASHK